MAFFPALEYHSPPEMNIGYSFAVVMAISRLSDASEYTRRQLLTCNTYQRTISLSKLHSGSEYSVSSLVDVTNYAKKTILHTLYGAGIVELRILKLHKDDDVHVLTHTHLDYGVTPLYNTGEASVYTRMPLLEVEGESTTALYGVFPAALYIAGSRLIAAETYFPPYDTVTIHASNTWGRGPMSVTFSAELTHTLQA